MFFVRSFIKPGRPDPDYSEWEGPYTKENAIEIARGSAQRHRCIVEVIDAKVVETFSGGAVLRFDQANGRYVFEEG